MRGRCGYCEIIEIGGLPLHIALDGEDAKCPTLTMFINVSW